jgi:phosphate-selective porin OprO/OprP
MSGRLVSGIVALALGGLPAAAWAQSTGTSAGTAGWRDGFVLQSDTGDYRLQISALIQADGRFGLDDSDDLLVDTFLFRRVRPILQGRLARYFEFSVQTDFAGSAVNLRAAYVETRFSPAFRVRVGKDKTPFGLERLHSSAFLLFVERAFPTSVAPDRDIGVQILGDVRGGLVSYAAGIFNGVVDGGSAETDTNDDKDLAGRVVVRPFATRTDHPLAGLGVALAATRGTQPATVPSFRTPAQQTFFTYDRNATGEGVRHRISPQAFYYYKRFGGFTEYVRSRGRISTPAAGDDVLHEAWQLAGSIVLTGESASDRGVRPARAFDPAAGRWGALQVAARYHALDVDPRAAALGLAGSGSRRARAFAVGANWYLNPIVKWVLNVERTTFDGAAGAARPPELALLVRNQIAF